MLISDVDLAWCVLRGGDLESALFVAYKEGWQAPESSEHRYRHLVFFSMDQHSATSVHHSSGSRMDVDRTRYLTTGTG